MQQEHTRAVYDVADEYRERTADVTEPVAVAVVAAEPLRIVQHPTRAFTAGQISLSAGTARGVVGANPFRDRLILQNTGAVRVFIGPAADTLGVGTGYPLQPDAVLELRTRDAVFAMAAPGGDGGELYFLAEHVDG